MTASRITARDGNGSAPPGGTPWVAVAVDIAAWFSSVSFLVYMRRHGLATAASIKLGQDVMHAFAGKLHGLAGVPQ